MRGNPRPYIPPQEHKRSIPACAGEPLAHAQPVDVVPVYPRVCGGTTIARLWCREARGLSPRVRGNHDPASSYEPLDGSIPACAGEPRFSASAARSRQVYPRVCGGTPDVDFIGRPIYGLSPRVRGNRGRHRKAGRPPGSIPACAGEPGQTPKGRPTPGVYPRVCGGTHPPLAGMELSVGLSPRVRGNPCRPLARRGRRGSIPACAGEPGTDPGTPTLAGVYPCVCGGTFVRPRL